MKCRLLTSGRGTVAGNAIFSANLAAENVDGQYDTH